MAKAKPINDRDEITVAKSIFNEIVEFTEHKETPREKRAQKGGNARAKKLPPEQRREIARVAARAPFEPYQVDCYAAGTKHVEIPYVAIRDQLNRDGIMRSLLNPIEAQ